MTQFQIHMGFKGVFPRKMLARGEATLSRDSSEAGSQPCLSHPLPVAHSDFRADGA